MGSIPGSGRAPAAGNGNPLQYSCLGDPMDWGTWWVIVRGVRKSHTKLSTEHHTMMLTPEWMCVCVCVCVCVCSLIMLRKYGSRAITWKFFKTQNWVSFFRNVLAFIQINKWLVMNLVGWWIILIDLLLNYYWIWGWTPFDLPFNMLQSVFANSSFRIFATTHMSAWPPKQLRTFGSWSRAVIIEHTLEQGHL